MILLMAAAALLSPPQETALKHCSTQLNRPVARSFLAATTFEQAAALSKKVKLKTNCTATGKYSGFYSFEPTGGSVESVRGVVAEVLVKDDMRLAGSLPAHPLQRRYSRSWFSATGRHMSIDEMASCIAETNPRGILFLLQSGERGAAEKMAFDALEGSFKSCLRAEFKLVGQRQVMRGALADALYQRMVTQSFSQAKTEQR